MLINGWVRADGSGLTVTSTLIRCNQFTKAMGRLPEDGAELAAWELQRRGLDAEAFLALPVDEQLHMIAFAVNPVTMTTFSSFAADEWQANALLFEPLDADQLRKALAPNRAMPLTYGTAWLVRVYGAEPGQVLLEFPTYSVPMS